MNITCRDMRYRLIYSFLFLLAFLTACQEDDGRMTSASRYPEDGRMRIAPAVGELFTRADAEYEGTSLGLFLDYGDGDASTRYNVRWEQQADGWNPVQTMYWKNSTTPCAVYAYAPYCGEATEQTVTFAIPADQTGGTLAADLLSYAADGFVPLSGLTAEKALPIRFTHRLVKLTVNIQLGAQLGDDVSVQSLKLMQTTCGVKLSLAANGEEDCSTVAAADGAAMQDIAMYEEAEGSFTAIFQPGDGQKAGARMLEAVLSDGKEYVFTVPSTGLVDGGLQNGCAYAMNLRVGKDRLEVADVVTVGGWDTPGTDFSSDNQAENVSYKIVDGTYIVYDAKGLKAWAKAAASAPATKCILARDITLTGENNWTPVGDYDVDTEYTGTFDGAGHTIRGLNIEASSGDGVGFIGCLDIGGVLKNLILESPVVTATSEDSPVGSLVGYNNGTVSACQAINVQVIGNMYVGGIVGENGGSIQGSYAIGSVSGSSSNIGGIAGAVNSGTVVSCFFRGSVDGSSFFHLDFGNLYSYNISACYVESINSPTEELCNKNNSTYSTKIGNVTWADAISAMNEALGGISGFGWEYGMNAEGTYPMLVEKALVSP